MKKSWGFYTESTSPCHRCHLVVTDNCLITKKFCKVATVTRVLKFIVCAHAREIERVIKEKGEELKSLTLFL